MSPLLYFNLYAETLSAVCEPRTTTAQATDCVECPTQWEAAQEATGSDPPSQSASTSLSEQRGGDYKQYCEDSFKELVTSTTPG